MVYLKSPMLSSEEPKMPTDEERKKGKIPDENLWLWIEYKNIQTLVEDMIREPKQYLTLFSK